MDTDRYIRHVAADAGAMAAVARSGALEADVPTCPGWDLRELIVHTGAVHRHKVATLLGDFRDKPAPRPETPGDATVEADLVDWFEEGAARLLDACRTADLDEPTWTWCTHDHKKDWWVRRMAHETVIHRIDADITVGMDPAIDPWLAEDGVDEILDEFIVGGPAWGEVTSTDRTARLRAGNRVWGLRTAVFSGTSPHSGKTYDGLDTLVYDDVSDANVTVATDPATMDLWLWGRSDLPDDAVVGDASVSMHLRNVAAEATG